MTDMYFWHGIPEKSAGTTNGYGGGVEAGETPVQAAIREVEEETRGDRKPGDGVAVRPEDLRLSAVLTAHRLNAEGMLRTAKILVFLCDRWNGDIISTKEMIDPCRYPREKLPLADMMLADRYWLPPVLAGKKVLVEFTYARGFTALIGDVQVKEVERLSAE
ncbi:MAG: NUDIX domain-containing protein [Patescibacteria group bacterium]|nr:NUDIX domain-containing protein [Patescibacteria group bacterium]MDE1946064.1 NUDIX domain-containing protein [Patescibacteria group bacterium]